MFWMILVITCNYCHNVSVLKFILVVVIMIVWSPSCITFICAYLSRINKYINHLSQLKCKVTSEDCINS